MIGQVEMPCPFVTFGVGGRQTMTATLCGGTRYVGRFAHDALPSCMGQGDRNISARLVHAASWFETPRK
jgi:hypothetical protein